MLAASLDPKGSLNGDARGPLRSNQYELSDILKIASSL